MPTTCGHLQRPIRPLQNRPIREPNLRLVGAHLNADFAGQAMCPTDPANDQAQASALVDV